MFNGIIFNKAKIKKIIKRPKGLNIFLRSNLPVSKKDIGISISCDGVCLTLLSYKNKIMEFYLSNETILRSKFQFLKVHDVINVELPLKYGQKISGHLCQGHVDTIAKVIQIKKVDKSYLFSFAINYKERKNLIEKASICINGISLTISKKIITNLVFFYKICIFIRLIFYQMIMVMVIGQVLEYVKRNILNPFFI